MADHADVNAVPLEHQYVLYAAATHSTLLELLTEWQSWLPDMEWSEMAAHIPALAEAITVLAAQGQVQMFFGGPAGEMGLVSSADVPNIVMDANNWWSPIQGMSPRTELRLSPEAGLAPLPQRRPQTTDAHE